MISKPSVAKYKYTLDSEVETTRQIATSAGREIISVLLTAGGGSAAARICDSADGVGDVKESILIAANAGESTPFTPTQPIPMRKGIYLIIEQGAPGAELHITYN